MSSSRIQPIILAAGVSTRMKSERSKLLQNLLGRPVICWAFDQAKKMSDEKPIFVLGHQRELITDCLVKEFGANSFEVVVQDPPLGTGDAVKKALEKIGKNPPADSLFIMGGDAVLLRDESVKRWRSDFLQKKCVLSFLTAVLSEPGAYGRVCRGPAGSPLKIVEYKQASDSEKAIQEINAGFYLIQLNELAEAVSQLEASEGGSEFYLTDMVEILNRRGSLIWAECLADATESYGINTAEDLYWAQKEVQKRINRHWLDKGVRIQDLESVWIEPKVQIDLDVDIEPGVHLRGSSKISSGCHLGAFSVLSDVRLDRDVSIKPFSHLESAEIGTGSLVGPYARLRPGSVLGSGVRVGNFVEIKNSQLDENSKVSHLSYVGDTHIGQNSNIGAGTITCNFDGIRKHRTEIEKSVFIGSNSCLVAPVRIGEGAIVGAGSVITKDVTAGSMALERSDQFEKPGAALRYRQKRKNPGET